MNLNNRLINQQQKKIVLIILPPLSSLSIFKLLLFVQNSFQSNHMAQLTIRFMSSVLFLSTDLDFFFFLSIHSGFSQYLFFFPIHATKYCQPKMNSIGLVFLLQMKNSLFLVRSVLYI